MGLRTKKWKPFFIGLTTAIVVLGVIIVCFFVISDDGNQEKADNSRYTAQMVEISKNKKSKLTKEIFDFEFDRGYVLSADECYYSGQDFAEEHDLDLNIDQVSEGIADYHIRIIFVDRDGNFVKLYTANVWEIGISPLGSVIYPNTIVTYNSANQDPVNHPEVIFTSSTE